MKTNKKGSFLAGIPPWGLAMIALVAPFILMMVLFFLGAKLKIGERIGEEISEAVFYILFDAFIAVCCFFIIRQNPKSIWYVPIISNVIGIISAISEPNFWISSIWMFIGGGWVLSIIASVIGYIVGRRSQAPSLKP